MTIPEFNNLKVGDIVWYLSNTGMAGLSKYQYIGIFKSHTDNIDYHVFLSEYFCSTRAIEKGREHRSISMNSMFLTESEAKEVRQNLINQNKQ